MTDCPPENAVVPLPCPPTDGGGSPGDVTVVGCCSPSIAGVPLCLPDCTPIVVLVQTACGDCDADPAEPATAGWIDLATGVFTAGSPPAGAGPCAACGQDESPPEPCTPTPMCQRLVGMSGPDQWVMPDGTESLSVSIVCGPVTITDCAGEPTVINEGCGSLSWTAPSADCEPGVLCGPFTVDVPDGSAVYINWTEPCGGEAP